MAPDGRLLPPGEVGEVVARGDLLMGGYWKLPEKTAQTLVDGWLHTGDRGLIDERGYLYLKDRLKDMVITGGFNVYPVDVENALGQHPAVHECAVFGVPDDKWGEAVQAAVQLRPGMQAQEAELIAFVRERGPGADTQACPFPCQPAAVAGGQGAEDRRARTGHRRRCGGPRSLNPIRNQNQNQTQNQTQN